MNSDLRIIALIKQDPAERYVFIYRDEHTKDLLRVFGKFAANSKLSFSWYDAAILARKVQEGWNPSSTPSQS